MANTDDYFPDCKQLQLILFSEFRLLLRYGNFSISHAISELINHFNVAHKW